MKILLINNNPVVSRLTALSARKEDIKIDEIQEVTELSSDTYDIVFVDADSWTKDVRDVISENIKTQKSVLFYADGDEDEKASFDLSILKPFLPSEVSAVIRSIEEENEKTDLPLAADLNHFNVLDDAKEENKNALFDLDELDEKKTVEVDETVKDINFDDKLEEAFPLKNNSLDDELFSDKVKVDLDTNEVSKEKELDKKEALSNDLFDLDLSDELPSLEDELFTDLKKEVESEELDLSVDVLEVANKVEELSIPTFDEELLMKSDEIKMDDVKIDEVKITEVKKETKILDESEIANIKGILTEDISDDLTLEDLMPPMSAVTALEVKKIEEKGEVNTDSVDTKLTIDSNEVAQSLATMPIESLRDLLAGATVKIKIKFPKSK